MFWGQGYWGIDAWTGHLSVNIPDLRTSIRQYPSIYPWPQNIYPSISLNMTLEHLSVNILQYPWPQNFYPSIPSKSLTPKHLYLNIPDLRKSKPSISFNIIDTEHQSIIFPKYPLDINGCPWIMLGRYIHDYPSTKMSWERNRICGQNIDGCSNHSPLEPVTYNGTPMKSNIELNHIYTGNRLPHSKDEIYENKSKPLKNQRNHWKISELTTCH